MIGRYKIPSSWMWVKIGDISEIYGGGTPPSSDESNFNIAGFPWITPADLTGFKEAYIERGRRSLTDKGLALSSAQILPKDTVLLSSRAPIGYCVIAANELTTSQGFKSFVFKGGVNAEFARFYLLASVEYAKSLAKGTTFKELSGSRAAEIHFPLAPIAEQQKIVNKLNHLFCKTRAAQELLSKIPRLVNIYKERILRRAFQQNVKRKGDGQTTWPEKTIGELIFGIKAGKNLRCEERPPSENEKGILKVSAVTWGSFDPSASKTLPSDYVPDESTKVKNGDFLFSRANTVQLVGAVVIVENAPDNLYLSDKILRLEMQDDIKRWLLVYLRSPMGRESLEKFASGNQESMRNISQANLRSIKIPFPSEQIRNSIITAVNSTFKRIDLVLSNSKGAMELIGNLNKEILNKAIRGELLPQKPDDEPVAELYSKIILEKSQVSKIKRKKSNLNIKKMSTKTLIEVLTEANEWLSAQEAFQRCGITSTATTDEIEPLYAELREIDLTGRLSIEPVLDVDGRKLFDKIKLNS